MPTTSLVIPTSRLRLVLESTKTMLARMRTSPPSPWTHGFAVVARKTGDVIGAGGYKGPPDADGMVEIAYGLDPDHRGQGYAKEAAAALVAFALGAGAKLVRAHTEPGNGASSGVLAALGFDRVGEVVDPEDGLVWRWEIEAHGSSEQWSR
jgi:RimJ/RimL family protein N-acetyltransferase